MVTPVGPDGTNGYTIRSNTLFRNNKMGLTQDF